MAQLDPEFLKDIIKEVSRDLVKEICDQNELLASKKDLSESQKLDLLKSFNRETVYKSFRDLELHIKFHTEGRLYKKYNIYNTTDPK